MDRTRFGAMAKAKEEEARLAAAGPDGDLADALETLAKELLA